ncbi:hypothetical protein [Mesorhizobium sp. M1409]
MFAQLMVDETIGASAEDEAIEIDTGEGGNRDRRHGDPNGG